MLIRALAIAGLTILVVATSLLMEILKMRQLPFVLAAVVVATIVALAVMSYIGVPRHPGPN